MRYIIPLLFTLTLLFSCKKIEVRNPDKPHTPGENSYHVYITNEGNFQSVNASVSRYDPKDGDVEKDYYKNVNNVILGDVCQSITLDNQYAYIVLNNSSKIEIVSRSEFRKINTLTGFTSPRYITIVNDKGYVTDLYANKISIINIHTGAILKTILIKGWTEEMLVDGNILWVTNLRSSYVYLIDLDSETLIDSIQTGYGPGSIQKDNNGYIWTLCQGDITLSEPAMLSKINPVTKSVTNYSLPAGSTRLRMNAEKTVMYFLANGIYRQQVDQPINVSTPWISKEGRNLYGLNTDPNTGDIYTSDVHDFISEGTIYHYTKEGALVRTFKAGINPNDFYFF